MASESESWPREVGGHLIERDIDPDPATGEVGKYHCVECGETFEEFDEETFERVDCSTVPDREETAGDRF